MNARYGPSDEIDDLNQRLSEWITECCSETCATVCLEIVAYKLGCYIYMNERYGLAMEAGAMEG
jgi:hypothetical protein